MLFDSSRVKAVRFVVQPYRQALTVDEPQINRFSWHTEVRDPRMGKCAVSHDAVARETRPTGLDGQTSYPMADIHDGTTHVRGADLKIIRLVAIDLQKRIKPHSSGGYLGDTVEKPVSAGSPDRIIGCL